MAGSAVGRIAREEWRYWSRSKTGIAASVVVMLLLLTSWVTTFVQVQSEREARAQLQKTAENTFRNQPARHPHRMVHYGHYVFRVPAPLAIIDPGIDPFTGTVMFLEGHRQNSATFAPQYTRPQAGPYAILSPALAYQLLVPLLLIVVGFASLSREREARTDQLLFTMAVSPSTFWLGKSLALALLALAALLPLALVAIQAWRNGEDGLIVTAFWFGYAAYLLCWVFLVTAASAWSKRATTALLVLLACWMTVSIVLPRVASSTADTFAPLNSKVQNDLEITQVLRDKGDSHDANDPAFAKLSDQLLAQYSVDSIEALPVNFRGIVAGKGEEELTQILNRFADQRIDQEQTQAKLASAFSIASPYLALKSFSIVTASTGLDQHHQFLREAEAGRYSFVQSLNRVHTNDLSYEDDINRNKSAAASQRARVDAHHWRVLNDFEWMPASNAARLVSSAPYLAILLLWTLGAAWVGRVGALRSWRIGE